LQGLFRKDIFDSDYEFKWNIDLQTNGMDAKHIIVYKMWKLLNSEQEHRGVSFRQDVQNNS